MGNFVYFWKRKKKVYVLFNDPENCEVDSSTYNSFETFKVQEYLILIIGY